MDELARTAGHLHAAPAAVGGEPGTTPVLAGTVRIVAAVLLARDVARTDTVLRAAAGVRPGPGAGPA
ncbi:hypothetical protein [Kitasatospora sp. NPDC098663]|uniref:hypothetical protein n=1 Tax=Kitasatospora sp. NPDC098663 TaxID=3364096 RepID=UPI0038124DAF